VLEETCSLTLTTFKSDQTITVGGGHGSVALQPDMINDLWYKNAVIYCLSVGTYMDANGDGTGDFQGLMRRLDYLHGLGVTAIWLMPFQTSPCRDDGYDVVWLSADRFRPE
jgi:1,4-alpha-glucan branching enzyme